MEKAESKKVNKYLAVLLLPTIIVLTDFIIRFSYITNLPSKLLKYFVASYAYEIVLFYWIIRLTSRLKRRKISILILAFIIASVELLVYSHYFYFGVLPNTFSLNFIFENFQNTLSIAGDTISPIHALSFLFILAAYFSILSFSVNNFPKTEKAGTYSLIFLLIGGTLVINNNVRFHPSSFAVVTNTIFSSKYFIQSRFFGTDFVLRKGYMQRKFEIKENVKITSQVNVLLILSESVRKRNLHYYGYERNTSPFVSKMIEDGKVIAFDNFFASSNSTAHSVPILLSGIMSKEQLQVPYVYDYIKTWTDSSTFYISSQSMENNNVDLRYGTLLDTYIYQENSGLEAYNDMGVDDYQIYAIVEKLLSEKEDRFFGMIQLNNTHYPYKAHEDFRKFLPARLKTINAYDNTLLEMDALIEKYFKFLAKSGLLDSTIIIFTSDHGEAFKDHNHSGHLQTLYNEEIAVPFWIYLPENFDSNKLDMLRKNRNKTIGHLNVFPTILDIYNILDHNSLSAKIDGLSLFKEVPENAVAPMIGASMILTRGIVSNNYKLIKSKKDELEIIELFNIKNDPLEEKNLLGSIPEDEYKELLSLYDGQFPSSENP